MFLIPAETGLTLAAGLFAQAGRYCMASSWALHVALAASRNVDKPELLVEYAVDTEVTNGIDDHCRRGQHFIAYSRKCSTLASASQFRCSRAHPTPTLNALLYVVYKHSEPTSGSGIATNIQSR